MTTLVQVLPLSQYLGDMNKPKLMWYAVDEDGTKALYSVKPVRSPNVWIWPDEYEDEDVDYLEIQDDEVAMMGLPDLAWEDEPIQVKVICVNV